ncbi:MAG: mannose-6-phosphate isomerase, class I [Sciscionella sp.]
MELLRNAVRPYAWGSRTIIAELLGREVPAPHPEAELWLGAHPGDPSVLVAADGTERSLLDLLRAEPQRQLGVACSGRWGSRLPFLLKILAAEEALSLQAHPSQRQSEEGYAREEAAGIPRDAANRNYPDPTAKPELLCALTTFHALAGFREAERTVTLLRSLDVPELDAYIGLLAAQPDSDGLRALFTTLITLPQRSLDELLPRVLDACVAHVRAHGEFAMECRTALELGEAYPRDAGVLAVLLLNRIVLRPGEAIYLPAGNLHAYLRGTAIEILANSDNILRCGLTTKHINVPELLRVLDFSHGDMPVSGGEIVAPNLRVYRTAAEEFELSAMEWAAGQRAEVCLEHDGPQIVICVSGAAGLLRKRDGSRQMLRQGDSVWLSAADGAVLASSQEAEPARIFRATAGSFRA